MIRRIFLLVLGLTILASPAAGQQHSDLGQLLDDLVDQWEKGDARGLAKLGATAGVELEVQGHSMGSLTGRRAAAALRHLFSAQHTVAVRSSQLSRVAGASNRAFVELTWEVRPGGTPASERHTVFIGFVREGDDWKVSQIRVLP